MKTLAVLEVDKLILKNARKVTLRNDGKKVPLLYRFKAAVCVLMGWHTKMALHDGILVAYTFDIQHQVGNQLHVAGIRVPHGFRHWVYESYWVPTIRGVR